MVGTTYVGATIGTAFNTHRYIDISDGQITNQIKSRCQPNVNSYRLYSLRAKCHQCTSGLTVNVSAKIKDGTIIGINSLTQLQ